MREPNVFHFTSTSVWRFTVRTRSVWGGGCFVATNNIEELIFHWALSCFEVYPFLLKMSHSLFFERAFFRMVSSQLFKVANKVWIDDLSIDHGPVSVVFLLKIDQNLSSLTLHHCLILIIFYHYTFRINFTCVEFIIGYQLSIINYQLSIIHYPSSIINYQLSIIHYQLSIIHDRFNAILFSNLPAYHSYVTPCMIHIIYSHSWCVSSCLFGKQNARSNVLLPLGKCYYHDFIVLFRRHPCPVSHLRVRRIKFLPCRWNVFSTHVHRPAAARIIHKKEEDFSRQCVIYMYRSVFCTLRIESHP